MQTKPSGSVRIFYPAFDRARLIRRLREGAGRLARVLPVRRVVLFGSYATGAHTVASDIDLLVIYAGEPREDAYALTKRTLNLPRLEPHLYTEAAARTLAPTLERMTAGGIVLLPGKETGEPQ